MKHTYPRSSFFLTIVYLAFLSGTVIKAQEGIQYAVFNELSTLTFNGDASVNDFSVEAEEIEGSVTFFSESESIIPSSIDSAENGQVTIPVKSMKGGNFLFNQDMYGALNAKEYPEIRFRLLALNTLQVDTLSTEARAFEAAGDLTISGTTREITFNIVTSSGEDNQIQVKGSTSLLMSEFNIEPPKKFFGALKVEDRVDIKFNIVLKPVEN
jgi:polyisoprenoid-binding protein YceI